MSEHISLQISADMAERLERYRLSLEAKFPGVKFSKSAAVRYMLEQTMAAV